MTHGEHKYNAVYSLYSQFGKIMNTLHEISKNPNLGDGVASAVSILKKLDLQFVFLFSYVESNILY